MHYRHGHHNRDHRNERARKFYSMHVGKGNKYGTGRNKIAYAGYWHAVWAMIKVKIRHNDEQQIYRCYWTDDERWLEAALHYHLGHSRYYDHEFDDALAASDLSHA